jgi:hypothetical protein
MDGNVFATPRWCADIAPDCLVSDADERELIFRAAGGVQLIVNRCSEHRAQVNAKVHNLVLFLAGRRPYELLVSIYAALLVITEEAFQDGSVFLGRLDRALSPLYWTLTRILRHQVSQLDRINFMWAALALIILLIVHTTGRLVLARRVICNGAGLIIVAGFPAVWLHFGTMFNLSTPAIRWLQTEVIGIIGGLVLYLAAGLPRRPAASTVILVSHFGLWGWVTRDAIPGGFWWAYLLLGVFSAAAWSVQIKTMRCGGA